jgi:hypothetical protein
MSATRGRYFSLASCAQTKKVAGTCSLSRISRIGRVFLLGPSSKVRQTILGSAVSPVAADTAKQSLGVSVSAYSRWYSRWMMPDSITSIAASTTPASNLAFRSSLSASRRMASPSSVVVWYRVCGHGGK